MYRKYFFGPGNRTAIKLSLRRTLVLQEQKSAFNSPSQFAETKFFKYPKCLSVSFIICCILFFSCSSNKNPYENNLGINPVTIAQMDTANYTQILWDDSVINIGTINAADTAAIPINFRFKNVGDKPLFVISVGATCGCTIANYSKEPLFPGKESVINAAYRWNGQTGTVRKTIFVKTNTKNRSSHTLVFYGEVVKDIAVKK